MSLDIDNKVYRNMQEQVAHNASNIQKIKEYLDGIQIEDKLVVVENSSGTISDKDLAVLMNPLAFVSYNNGVYIKASESLTEIVFKLCDISAAEVGSAYFNIGGYKVVITKSTKAYILSEDPIITTYSKSQTDSIVANIMALKADKSELTAGLALKADLSGATFTGAVKAPTFEQSQANYTKEFSVYGLPVGLSVSPNSFKAFKVINGVLYVIAALVVSNDTENDITGGFTLFANGVDSQVGSKIKKCDGTDLTQTSTFTDFGWEICYSPVIIVQSGGGERNSYSRIYSPAANRLDATIPSQTWLAGKKYLISIRVPIILV